MSMAYTPPVSEMSFVMEQVACWRDGLARVSAEVAQSDVETILSGAAGLAADIIAPLNLPSDRSPATWRDGDVTMPAGWKAAYRAWADAGWIGISLPAAYGGMGMPAILGTATMEMLTSACMAMGTMLVLTHGAVDALVAHASDELKRLYVPKLISGVWAATMDLTESQAGSDLGTLRTSATPAEDGSYRIKGQKIFITFGEHDLTENIVHLVLARLPGAPAGTRGISLFIVPKFIPAADGSCGPRNDVSCAGIEHKLGIRSSPTCTMTYGENSGAAGWLVGEPNQGLRCMFTMMNKSRLATGLQGVAIAERATQQALAYARERRQGRNAGGAPAAIIEHPDVSRNVLTMMAWTAAARAIAYRAAAEIERSASADTAASRDAACLRADLLTPLTKAFASDAGVEVASLGIQVHGGIGYVEEAGAAQHWRDARIAPIYEGTNGIQAIDLVMRRVLPDGGAVVVALIEEMRAIARKTTGHADDRVAGMAERLSVAIDACAQATQWLLDQRRQSAELLAVATPYLKLLGICLGGTLLAKSALAATESASPVDEMRVVIARFYAESIAVTAEGWARNVMGSAGVVSEAAALFSSERDSR